jgi:hypothetical protein
MLEHSHRHRFREWSVVELQIATLCLIQFDGFKQSFKVARTKTLEIKKLF